MKIAELVFHGVPQGFDVWGTSGDKYYESFYAILDIFKEAKPVFVVEIRKDSNKWCSYYSYIRSQNVIAEGGRTGSYFGMSLKLDGEYCTDVYSLFKLMDTIYEQKVVGKIVSKNGSSEKFIVAAFENATGILKEISNLFIGLIKSNFEDDFENIEPSLNKKNASTSVYYNVNDVNSESFFYAVKEFGKIFISTAYPSKDAIIANLTSSDKKYQLLKAEYESQIDSLKSDNKQIPGLKSKVDSLSQEAERSKAEVKTLSTEKSNLLNSQSTLQKQLSLVNQEKDKLKKLSNIGSVAEKLESSVNEMLELLKAANLCTKDGDNSPDEGRGRSLSDLKHYIPHLLAIVAVVFAIVFFFKGNKSEPMIAELKKQNGNLTEQISTIQRQCAELEKENKSLKEELDEINTQDDRAVSIDFYTVDNKRIDGTLCLKSGNTYIVKALGVEQGHWKSDGITIEGDKSKTEARIKVDREGTVYLSFCKNDAVETRLYRGIYRVEKK